MHTLIRSLLLGLSLTACGIADSPQAQDVKILRAPVVVPSSDDPLIMRQIAWFAYPENPDGIVLYCMPTGEVTLQCVVYLTRPHPAIVIVEDIVAQQTSS